MRKKKYTIQRLHYRKNKKNTNSKKALIKNLLLQGMSCAKIADDYGFNRQYINNISIELGFRYRKERKDRNQNTCESLNIELNGPTLQRYKTVRLFRLFCAVSKIEWSMNGLKHFEKFLYELNIDPDLYDLSNAKNLFPLLKDFCNDENFKKNFPRVQFIPFCSKSESKFYSGENFDFEYEFDSGIESEPTQDQLLDPELILLIEQNDRSDFYDGSDPILKFDSGPDRKQRPINSTSDFNRVPDRLLNSKDFPNQTEEILDQFNISNQQIR